MQSVGGGSDVLQVTIWACGWSEVGMVLLDWALCLWDLCCLRYIVSELHWAVNTQLCVLCVFWSTVHCFIRHWLPHARQPSPLHWSWWSEPLLMDSFGNLATICWRREWHPTPVLLPGKPHGRRSLVGCSPWGREESDTTEWLHFHFSLLCIGEGNGNPLQCSCLENPRDRGAWWAAVSGVAQSRTRLKQLSSSSSNLTEHSELSSVVLRSEQRSKKSGMCCFTWKMCWISLHSVQGDVLVMVWPLSLSHLWESACDTHDGLEEHGNEREFIYMDLYTWAILFSWWFLVDGLFCMCDIKLNGPWLGVLLILTFLE